MSNPDSRRQASNTHTHPRILRKLAYENVELARVVAKNPSAPPDLLAALASHQHDPELQKNVTGNPNIIRVLLTITLLGAAPILYLTSGILSVNAQNQPRSPNIKFGTFVEKGKYSIAYPQGWFVERANKDLLYITNRKMPKVGGGGFPDYFVKTDVQIENENFQNILARYNSSNRQDSERLIKRERFKIDGKNAVRFWFTGGETEVLITIFPYKQSKTVYLASFYTANNSKVTPILERIHSSFKSLN